MFHKMTLPRRSFFGVVLGVITAAMSRPLWARGTPRAAGLRFHKDAFAMVMEPLQDTGCIAPYTYVGVYSSSAVSAFGADGSLDGSSRSCGTT